MKFLRCEGLSFTEENFKMPFGGGMTQTFSGIIHCKVVLDLSNDPECFNACTVWIDMVRTDYTVESYKVDIGSYVGLWPSEAQGNGIVTFIMDKYDTSRQSWKDWFIIEEKETEYASK